MSLTAALIGGGASLLGGLMSNRANAKAASEQMDFQERMSNTAYQRAMDDMRAAGLNPLLAAKLGGASTPGGAMPVISDALTPAVSTGLNVYEGSQRVEQSKQEQQLKKAQVVKTQQEIGKVLSSTLLDHAQIKRIQSEVPRILADIDRIAADKDLKTAMLAIPDLVSDVVEALRKIGNVVDSDSIKQVVERALHFQIRKNPELINVSKDDPWYKRWFGVDFKYIPRGE
jgi:hypothetical protein